MKKILFIYFIERNLGIVDKAKKIEKGFSDENCKVKVIGYVGRGRKIKRIIQIIGFYLVSIFTITKIKYDIIFIRNSYYFIFIYIICLLMKKEIQVEINSKESEEFSLKKMKIRKILAKIALNIAVKCSSKVHTVTHELVDYYKKLFPEAFIIYNPNFVVDEYMVERKSNIHQNIKANIVFLGSTAQAWHGMDLFIKKVVVGNSWFLENCKLHIVGFCSAGFKSLIKEYDLRDIVVLHGYQNGVSKKLIMNEMNVGVAGLNLKLKGLSEATPIKVAEFLHAGLPIIIGYDDNRLKNGLPFILKIGITNGKTVLQNKINEFIKTSQNNYDLIEQAQKYAKKNMMVNNYIKNIIT